VVLSLRLQFLSAINDRTLSLVRTLFCTEGEAEIKRLVYLSPPPPNRFPYFVVVVRVAWSFDPVSCAGGSAAGGRDSQRRLSRKNGYSGPSISLGFLTLPNVKTN
jgi:hypothetical protein